MAATMFQFALSNVMPESESASPPSGTTAVMKPPANRGSDHAIVQESPGLKVGDRGITRMRLVWVVT